MGWTRSAGTVSRLPKSMKNRLQRGATGIAAVDRLDARAVPAVIRAEPAQAQGAHRRAFGCTDAGQSDVARLRLEERQTSDLVHRSLITPAHRPPPGSNRSSVTCIKDWAVP